MDICLTVICIRDRSGEEKILSFRKNLSYLIVNFLLTINFCPTLSLTKKLGRIMILLA